MFVLGEETLGLTSLASNYGACVIQWFLKFENVK